MLDRVDTGGHRQRAGLGSGGVDGHGSRPKGKEAEPAFPVDVEGQLNPRACGHAREDLTARDGASESVHQTSPQLAVPRGRDDDR